MVAGKFKKQPSESWTIYGGFAENMDIDGGEDLVLVNCTVVCLDPDGNDVSTTMLDQTTKAIGTGTDKGKLYIKVNGGVGDDGETYKITFLTGDTSVNERWEKDVFMTLKEI